MKMDLFNQIKGVRALSPVVATDGTSQVCQVVDTAGFDSLTFFISTGTLSDSDTTYTVLVEDSDTNFSGAAVVDAQLLGTEAGAGFQFDDDNEIRKIGYLGSKRYVRVTIDDVTANTGNVPLCVIAVLGHPRTLPQSSQAT